MTVGTACVRAKWQDKSQLTSRDNQAREGFWECQRQVNRALRKVETVDGERAFNREPVHEEAAEEVVPRRMFIRKQDVEEHGYTTRCPGCVSILRGTARQEHTAECRRRMEKELGRTQRARMAKKKV